MSNVPNATEELTKGIYFTGESQKNQENQDLNHPCMCGDVTQQPV